MSVLLVLLALLASWLLLGFLIQREAIYPGARLREAPALAPSGARQVVMLETSQGRVEAWYLPPTDARGASGPAPALLFAHGNGELIDDWPDAFAAPRADGLAVLLVEYPGYGRSPGRPTQASVVETMVAAFDWLARHPDVDAERIIGHGRSLGGGAICALSRERPLAALLLESTFTSIRAFTHRYLMYGPLTRDPYDNEAALAHFAGPVLIVHGTHDKVVPFQHAQRLARASPRTRLVPLDCGHNDCPRPWPAMRELLLAEGLLPERQ